MDAAVTAYQQAVDATPVSDPGRARYLFHLGLALRARSVETRQAADLDAAISAFQQAVDATPASDPNRARYMSNLGTALQDRLGTAGQARSKETRHGG